MLSKKDMIEAIKRSGYLLESEITKLLASHSYFLQSNISILDPLTKKSREIDLVAEMYDRDNNSIKQHVYAQSHFVFEIKNNLYPMILMTKQEVHPDTDNILGLKEMITIPEGIVYNHFESFYESLLEKDDCIFTQYCSFDYKKKKNNKELMANHPENMHSGFAKITQYCDDHLNWHDEEPIDEYYNVYSDDQYFRHWIYIPILLINDGLYELELDGENEVSLKEVLMSKLVYNYHLYNEPKMSIIFVMTKKGLNLFLPKMRALEKKVENKMIISKTKKLPEIGKNV